MTALLLFVVVAARGESAVPTNLPDGLPDYGSLPGVGVGGANTGTGTGTPGDPTLVFAIVGVIAGLLLVIAGVLAALQARKRRRLARVGAPLETDETVLDVVSPNQVARAVTEAQELLARPGGTPGDAIIEAWLIVERATAHGRAPHETPTEFTVAVLEREDADPDALRRLLKLYQRARFAPRHETDDHDVDSARRALDRILTTVR